MRERWRILYLLKMFYFSPSEEAVEIISLFNIFFFFCRFVYTYFQSGRWLYGLFQVLNWYERIFFMVFNYGASVVVMKLGMLLQKAKGQVSINLGCSGKLE